MNWEFSINHAPRPSGELGDEHVAGGRKRSVEGKYEPLPYIADDEH